jgi:hypothetical protein
MGTNVSEESSNRPGSHENIGLMQKRISREKKVNVYPEKLSRGKGLVFNLRNLMSDYLAQLALILLLGMVFVLISRYSYSIDSCLENQYSDSK